MKKTPPAPDAAPLGALASALGALGFRDAGSDVPPAAAPAAPAPAPAAVGKVVVRRETQGRKGKTVTVIRGLALSPGARDALVKQLKTGLGTGAGVEDDAIVVQGDLVARVVALLEREGVRRVVAG